MNSVSELYVDAEHTNSHTGSSFQVEHGVPLPVKQAKQSKEKKVRVSRYPFASMSPGDSFHMPGVDVKRANSALAMGRKIHQKSQWTVAQENGGVRIWRRA